MRLLFTTFLTLVSLALFSQSPEKINYQSIVRDLAGNVIQNQPISLRMSILSDSINGTIVYQETFQPTTNNFGLVNIKIGEGTPVIATMSSVDWSNGPFFLESAVDVTGGTNYIVVSTSQFMSVPYALYASESPLDTTQVQNIVNQQTNNFLDSTSIQNMIDSSVLNIDSTLIASWGYIDSNSIMILINNNSLDSTTIQNMIDNSIVNIDSSTVASWGYLDSSTIQILINNSTIDSSSVANWGYLDSTTIQNIITQQTNNYLDSTSIQNMIDNSVTNIDSSTVASWGYVDSSSIMILINNNSLDSAAIQNMINSSITNVDSSTVASWGYLDSSSIIALISNSNIDSSSVASWGYLDSVSIQNMINNSSVNVDSTMIANFGFVAGPHTIDTDTQIDSTGIANYGFVTSSQVLDSLSVQNMINNSSSNVDSSTVSNWGFVDSSTVINLINQSGYLDSLTIQSMIDLVNNSGTSLGAFGDYQDINFTWSAPNGTNSYFSGSNGVTTQELFSSNDSYVFLNGTGGFTNSFEISLFYSDSSGEFNQPPKFNFLQETLGTIVIPIPKNKFWRLERPNGGAPLASGSANSPKILEIISDSSSGSGSNSTIDSTTISNMGFVDSMTVVNMINSGGVSGGITFIDPVALFSGTTYSYNNTTFVYHEIQPGWSSQTPNLTPHNSVYLNKDTLTINIDSILGVHYDNFLITCITSMNNNYSSTYTPISSVFVLNNNVNDVIPIIYNKKNRISNQSSQLTSSSVQCIIPNSDNGIINLGYEIYSASVSLIVTGYINNTTGSGSNSSIDSTTVANWGFSTDTQLDSTGIANLGYVAGPHTIDTDTQIDSAGIAAMGYLDSVSIRNMIDSMVAQSVSSSASNSNFDLLYPDGFNNLTPFYLSNQMPLSNFRSYWFGTSTTISPVTYTPPTGKRLYIQKAFLRYIGNESNYFWQDYPRIKINGKNIITGGNGQVELSQPIIVSDNDTLEIFPMSIYYSFPNFTYYPSSVQGFLVDINNDVDAQTIDLPSSSYTIPNDKKLIITNIYKKKDGSTFPEYTLFQYSDHNVVRNINGYLDFWQGGAINNDDNYLKSPIILNQGETIKCEDNPATINGYLVDKDFFESSSSSSGTGSGSSSESSTDASFNFDCINVDHFYEGEFSSPSQNLELDNINSNKLELVIEDVGSIGCDIYIECYDANNQKIRALYEWFELKNSINAYNPIYEKYAIKNVKTFRLFYPQYSSTYGNSVDSYNRLTIKSNESISKIRFYIDDQSSVDASIDIFRYSCNYPSEISDSITLQNESINGSTFNSVKIGSQYWLQTDLDVTTYRDGTPIPEVTDPTTWQNLTTGAYCYYNNDPTYPKLYNWYAVMGIHDNNPATPDKNICPAGWHIPDTTEWFQLIYTLQNMGLAWNGDLTNEIIQNNVASSLASQSGWAYHWTSGTPGNSTFPNNTSNFNSFPVGQRSYGGFYDYGEMTRYWSSSEYSQVPNEAMAYLLWYSNVHFSQDPGINKSWGLSVRMVKD